MMVSIQDLLPRDGRSNYYISALVTLIVICSHWNGVEYSNFEYKYCCKNIYSDTSTLEYDD